MSFSELGFRDSRRVPGVQTAKFAPCPPPSASAGCLQPFPSADGFPWHGRDSLHSQTPRMPVITAPPRLVMTGSVQPPMITLVSVRNRSRCTNPTSPKTVPATLSPSTCVFMCFLSSGGPPCEALPVFRNKLRRNPSGATGTTWLAPRAKVFEQGMARAALSIWSQSEEEVSRSRRSCAGGRRA